MFLGTESQRSLPSVSGWLCAGQQLVPHGSSAEKPHLTARKVHWLAGGELDWEQLRARTSPSPSSGGLERRQLPGVGAASLCWPGLTLAQPSWLPCVPAVWLWGTR